MKSLNFMQNPSLSDREEKGGVYKKCKVNRGILDFQEKKNTQAKINGIKVLTLTLHEPSQAGVLVLLVGRNKLQPVSGDVMPLLPANTSARCAQY